MSTRGACATQIHVQSLVRLGPITFVSVRILTIVLILFSLFIMAAENTNAPTFDAAAAERFAKLALACVHKEYPNKISHVLNSDADVAPPRKLTPAFCGCYDWHSSVHGHWLLVRLLRTFPDASFAKAACDALKESLTAENLKAEAAYLRGEGRASFERPYGLAWLLQLCAELREWENPQAREMLANLKPLEDAAVERLRTWLPKLSHPVRIGEHDQTAFALALILATHGEAATANWLPVTVSPDPSDPKLAHLDGLNLSRAWMLEGITSALPADDPRRPALAAAAEAHRRAGLAAVTGEHYEGGHWLGSFAVYLTTQRGTQRSQPHPP